MSQITKMEITFTASDNELLVGQIDYPKNKCCGVVFLIAGAYAADRDHLLCRRGVKNDKGMREMADQAQQSIVSWIQKINTFQR